MSGVWSKSGLWTGRWQLPAAVAAVVVAAAALLRVKPPEHDVPFESLYADVLALVDARAYYDAADAIDNLLHHQPQFSASERATLHNTLAEVIYRQESLRPSPNRHNVKLLLDHYESAVQLGRHAESRDLLRVSKVHEWLGEAQAAIHGYRELLERDPEPGARRDALQALVRLLDGRSDFRDERRTYIEQLLDESGVSDAYLWWALRHAVGESLDRGEPQRADALLEQHGARFRRSDLAGYGQYLLAWNAVEQGRTDEAAPLIDWVDAWLDENARADTAMDAAGFLPALNRLLRGRVDLVEGRPQAALEAFDGALALQSHGETLVLATIGRAEALAALERHTTALRETRLAMERLRSDPPAFSAGRARIKQAMLALHDQRREKEDYKNAVGYLSAALELTPGDEPVARREMLERLGRAYALYANADSDRERSRSEHAQAARRYEDAAKLTLDDVARQGTLQWTAAQEYDAAGRTSAARRLLEQFVDERATDARLPRALLQIGRTYAAEGDFETAIVWYRRLTERFPQLEESVRARLLTADSLIALSNGREAEAERILVGLLDDELIAPQAEVFRDALFELSDLLYQQGRNAEAISRLEDFRAFYPNDREGPRVGFLLADAYRKSAYALREVREPAESVEPSRRESLRRFRVASRLFGELAGSFEASALPERERRLYERLSLFYQGDCLYEINEPDTLTQALAIYRQAAARYQAHPAALSAQVQIANIHLRRGRLTEAARAVERARWLLRSIPDQAYAESGGTEDRATWERYLTTVASSSLFQDVFAESR